MERSIIDLINQLKYLSIDLGSSAGDYQVQVHNGRHGKKARVIMSPSDFSENIQIKHYFECVSPKLLEVILLWETTAGFSKARSQRYARLNTMNTFSWRLWNAFFYAREFLLYYLKNGIDVEVLGNLSVIVVLLQTKELDKSMLDALGIRPQRKQHKKLLLVIAAA